MKSERKLFQVQKFLELEKTIDSQNYYYADWREGANENVHLLEVTNATGSWLEDRGGAFVKSLKKNDNKHDL